MLYKINLALFTLLAISFMNVGFCGATQEPWELEADRIHADQEKNLVEAFGNVRMWRMDDYVHADYARLYTDTNWIYLKGNIQARFEGDQIQGQEAELDLDNHVGWIKDGKVFMAQDNVHFSGKSIEKTGPHTYTFKEGVMTSCDDRPAPWSIKSSRGEVTVEGYARLWHPRFRVKDRPVLYSPYMIAPVKTERQSGFLFPTFGFGSEYRNNFNLPYYHVIDDQRDMTFYANYYTHRGFMPGLEYRHTPRLHRKGFWRADWLRDRQVHDQGNEPDRFEGDGLFRPNRGRYWIRGKYDHYDPATEWTYRLDVDYVSDQNYLREFSDGHSGYYASRDEFEDEFGRDIQGRDRLRRNNIFSASRSWNNLGFNTRLVYTDNLEYRNSNKPARRNPTVQRLPEVNLDLYRTSLGDSPFELESSNEGVYFWREFGTTATRLDVHPRLSMPIRSGWGRIIPSAGWRQTGYFVDNFQDDSRERDTDSRFQTRGIYDFNIRADTELQRIFEMGPAPEVKWGSVGESAWTGVKHSMLPKLEFDYIPDKDQDKYPRFDSTDRIAAREELTYSLRNIFTRRLERLRQGADEGEPVLSRDYRDFLRVEFEQSYDFREARRSHEPEESRRPFSDLLTEISFNPNQYITLSNKTWYSFYETMVTEHEHTLTLTWPDVARTWFSLDFLNEIDEYKRTVDDRINILEVGMDLDYLRNWRFEASMKRDMEDSRALENRLSAEYRHQCYGFMFEYKKTDYDHSFAFHIKLLNLGEWGI